MKKMIAWQLYALAVMLGGIGVAFFQNSPIEWGLYVVVGGCLFAALILSV